MTSYSAEDERNGLNFYLWDELSVTGMQPSKNIFKILNL